MLLNRLRVSGPSWLSELRLVVRTLRHGRGAWLAMGTIALVICGVTLVTSVMIGALIDRGPYARPSRVVGLQLTAPTLQYPRLYFPYDDYLALRDAMADSSDRVFDALLPLGVAYVMLTGSSEPAHLNAGVMPGETFERLGVSPLLGRPLMPGDDRAEAPPVVVLSEDVWRQSFGGDPASVGRPVRIDGQLHQIVGVMPRRFTWGVLNAWLPMRLDLYGTVTGRFVQITGWLRDGMTEAHASAHVNVLVSGLAAARPGQYPPATAVSFTHPALPAVRSDVRNGLVVLFVCVALLAVVGCVNVAALLLARMTGRLKEMSIRVSLGARRWQLVRGQLLEALVLGLVGAVAGVGLAYVLLPSVLAALPAGVLPLGAVVAVDARAVWGMSAATVIISLACGGLPALLVGRTGVEPALRQSTGGSVVSVTSRRIWRALIVVEVTMAMMLLVLTGVFGRSLLALRAAPLHYSPDRVVALGVTISEKRYPTPAHSAQVLQQMLERVRTIPGVEHAAMASPAGPRNNSASAFEITGRRPASDERVGVRIVGADYFQVYRIPVVRGRVLVADDERAARPVAVVNQAFAREYGRDGDVLGRHVRLRSLRPVTGAGPPTYEIVGIVHDVVNSAVTGRAEPEVAVPAGTAVQSRNWFLVARATGDDVNGLVKPIQKAVWTVDPEQAFRSVRTENEALWVARFGWPYFRALVLCLFGVLALALVGCGVYGIVAYTTAREARDLGIRLAIGSEPSAVLRHVISRGVRPVLFGVAMGALVAAAGATLLRAFLGTVSPWDPMAYLAATIAVVVVAVVACAVPAWRASRLDPSVVLRAE